MNGVRFTEHYVIVGWTPITRTVVREVAAAGFDIAVLTRNETDLSDLRAIFPDKNSVFATTGPFDDEEAYRRLNLQAAAGAIVLTGDDSSTLITVLELRALRPDLKLTAYIQNPQLKKTVENAGVSYVISPTEVVGRMIASATFEPDVSRLMEDLLATTTRQEDLDVQEFRLKPGHELVGKSMRDAAVHVVETTGGKLLSLARKIEGEWGIIKHESLDVILRPEDYLILLVDYVTAQRAQEYLGVGQGRFV